MPAFYRVNPLVHTFPAPHDLILKESSTILALLDITTLFNQCCRLINGKHDYEDCEDGNDIHRLFLDYIYYHWEFVDLLLAPESPNLCMIDLYHEHNIHDYRFTDIRYPQYRRLWYNKKDRSIRVRLINCMHPMPWQPEDGCERDVDVGYNMCLYSVNNHPVVDLFWDRFSHEQDLHIRILRHR